MNRNLTLSLFLLLVVSLGCSRLQNTQDNTNGSATPTPSASATPAATSGGTVDAVRSDLFSIGAGAFVVSASSEHTPGNIHSWSAYGLLDENPKTGWAAEQGKIADQTIVVQLPARTTIKTLGFDTAGIDTENAAAKDVMVEVAATLTSPYQKIFEGTLKNAEDGQDFPVEREIEGRFFKITVKNNYGSPEWVELLEVRGYGSQQPAEFDRNVSGTYKTTEWGDFHIKQEGTSIVGCYEHQEGTLVGGLEGGVMTLSWKETGDTERDRGPAVFLFSDDGKRFAGIWGYSDEKSFTGLWNGEKISDSVGGCSHYQDLSGENSAGSKIEKDLAGTGRSAVYGINFDFNSDRIKDESKPTLNQIVTVLKENPQWNMVIEGHTDNIGGDAFNQTLSEKRSQAVRAFLIAAGIAEGRLTAKGVGASKPVAENATEAGRARNRRVELVRQ